jgi:hypothetical protein
VVVTETAGAVGELADKPPIIHTVQAQVDGEAPGDACAGRGDQAGSVAARGS